MNSKTVTVSARLPIEANERLQQFAQSVGLKPSVVAAQMIVAKLQATKQEDDPLTPLLVRLGAIVIAALHDEIDLKNAEQLILENLHDAEEVPE